MINQHRNGARDGASITQPSLPAKLVPSRVTRKSYTEITQVLNVRQKHAKKATVFKKSASTESSIEVPLVIISDDSASWQSSVAKEVGL